MLKPELNRRGIVMWERAKKLFKKMFSKKKLTYDEWSRTDPWALAVRNLHEKKINRRFLS